MMRRLWPLCFVLVAACGPALIEGQLLVADEPATTAQCGDGACDLGETCGSCAEDCGECMPGCGDAVCDAAESCLSCPDDCGGCGATCGDMVCEGAETCDTCAQDCGACVPSCGDALCEGNETCGSCAEDCGACLSVCGNGACESDETCGSCEADCGACGPVCGDGMCNGGEDCGSCEMDCGACTWPPDLAATEDEMLILVNELRAVGANCGGTEFGVVPPLAMHEDLRTAARLHSQDMGEQNYFDHQSLDGRSPWARIGQAGYPGAPAAENLAAGNGTALATFDQWLNSPGHCRNMMTAQGNEIGIGHANVPGSQYRHYWTQAFGRR